MNQLQIQNPKTRITLPAIRKFHDPILHTVCEPVAPTDDLGFLDQLRDVCLSLPAGQAAGLAAPQIGIPKRAVFIRYGAQHGLLMINPVLLAASDGIVMDLEGCLSYPGIYVQVDRFRSVVCRWNVPSLNGGPWLSDERKFNNFESRVLQHEIDHLDGICKVGDVWRENANRQGAKSAKGEM